MGDSTMYRDPPPSTAGPLQDSTVQDVLQVLSGLASSTEPAVVFASLVRLCVPAVCDAATATITGPDEKVYAVSWPRDEVNLHDSQRQSVVARFEAPASGDHAGYRGVVSLRFGTSAESQPFLAQLLVERGMATVERARLSEAVARATAEVANLEVALTSNREISMAVGIVMANHRLTADEAFDVLKRISQDSNRKLHAIALEAIRTGVSAPPASLHSTDRSST